MFLSSGIVTNTIPRNGRSNPWLHRRPVSMLSVYGSSSDRLNKRWCMKRACRNRIREAAKPFGGEHKLKGQQSLLEALRYTTIDVISGWTCGGMFQLVARIKHRSGDHCWACDFKHWLLEPQMVGATRYYRKGHKENTRRAYTL